MPTLRCRAFLLQSVAQSFAGPIVAMFVMFAGFLVTRDKLANWLIWLYWISPMSWAIRSLAHNEFEDARYDYMLGDQRAGNLFLGAYALQPEKAYKWAGIGYMVRSANRRSWVMLWEQ